MTYPEKGAGYRRNPDWMERAKRAEGGAADEPLISRTNIMGKIGETPNERDAREKLNSAAAGLESLQLEDARKPQADRILRRASGGRVRRADGGAADTDRHRPLQGADDVQLGAYAASRGAKGSPWETPEEVSARLRKRG